MGSLAWASASQAAVISAAGGLSSAGEGPSIIGAPADATDDAAYNKGIQAFDEKQRIKLTSDLAVDGGTIAAGTWVSSHMVFLNSGPGHDTTLIEHGAGGNRNAVSFTFDGLVLGVMSDSTGALEVASSGILGNPATIYPGIAFSARGMKGNPLDGFFNDDWYAFAGDTIRLGMRVTEPGDWIRVVTAASPIPVPASLPLLAIGLGGLCLMSRRRRKAS
ncbi:MAG: PEP-CTERM sorting domain-containing protein [Rhizobiaceae bacterium]